MGSAFKTYRFGFGDLVGIPIAIRFFDLLVLLVLLITYKLNYRHIVIYILYDPLILAYLCYFDAGVLLKNIEIQQIMLMVCMASRSTQLLSL